MLTAIIQKVVLALLQQDIDPVLAGFFLCVGVPVLVAISLALANYADRQQKEKAKAQAWAEYHNSLL